MNVTLSLDEDVLVKARELARKRGTSLNQLIRDHLAHLVSDVTPKEIVEELEQLWGDSPGNSKGKRWSREDLHDRASQLS